MLENEWMKLLDEPLHEGRAQSQGGFHRSESAFTRSTNTLRHATGRGWELRGSRELLEQQVDSSFFLSNFLNSWICVLAEQFTSVDHQLLK